MSTHQATFYLDANGNVVPAGSTTASPLVNTQAQTGTIPVPQLPSDSDGSCIYWNCLSGMELVQMVIVYAFIAAGALAAIFVFWGGFSLILSGGDSGKVKAAIDTIRWAIIGIVITIFSFTIVAIIGRFFGLNLLDYISFEKIQQGIQVIINSAKGEMNAAEVANPFGV